MENEEKKPGHKPKPNHPWKNSACSKAYSWAVEQAGIRRVNNVTVARNKTLSTRNKPIHQGEGLK